MRRIFPYLLSFALVLGLSGCRPSETSAPPESPTATPAPTAEATATPTATPNADNNPYLADYDFFWKTLEENWPFRAAAERISGQSLADIRDRRRSGAAAATSSWRLYQILQWCVEDINSGDMVGHLSILSEEDYPSYLDVYRSLAGSPHCTYLAQVLDNAASRKFYGCAPSEAPSDGEADPPPTEKPPRSLLSFQDYPDEQAGYVKIPTFSGTYIPVDGPLLLDYFQELERKGYEHCILDIRGNGGGSTTYPLLNIIVPNTTGPLAPTSHYMLVRGGDRALAYLEAAEFYTLRPIDELPADALPALDAGDLAAASHFASTSVPKAVKADYPDTPAFSGKFWLLVDEGVYSSSEYFAILCKDTGFATLVGEPTGGDGLGIDPLITVLPNSGICFRFSSLNGLNPDGGCNEELGTAPDLPIQPGGDALALCLQTIGAEG